MFEARYKLQHKMAIGDMEAHLALSKENFDRFHAYLDCLIANVKAAVADGSFKRSFRVQWGSVDDEPVKKLTVRDRQEAKITEPEHPFMYYTEYMKLGKGEPAQNGHVRTTVKGRDIVLLPSDGIGKISISDISQADIDEVVADSTNAWTGPGQLEDMQSGYIANAVSAALPRKALTTEELLGGSSVARSPSSSSIHGGSSGRLVGMVAASHPPSASASGSGHARPLQPLKPSPTPTKRRKLDHGVATGVPSRASRATSSGSSSSPQTPKATSTSRQKKKSKTLTVRSPKQKAKAKGRGRPRKELRREH